MDDATTNEDLETLDFAMFEGPGLPLRRSDECALQARLEARTPVVTVEQETRRELRREDEMRARRTERRNAFLATLPVLQIEEYRDGRAFVWVRTAKSWARFSAKSYRQHSDDLRAAIRSAVALNPGCDVVVAPKKPEVA